MRGELARFGPEASLGGVLERWPAAVGDAVARNAWPSRVARDGTVHVATADSVWAFELGQQAAEIAARLGVPGVRFAPGPLPRAAAPEAPATVVFPGPAEEREAAALAARIEDENLRETVQKAISLGLARGAVDRPV